jgi:hypothetical protein
MFKTQKNDFLKKKKIPQIFWLKKLSALIRQKALFSWYHNINFFTPVILYCSNAFNVQTGVV